MITARFAKPSLNPGIGKRYASGISDSRYESASAAISRAAHSATVLILRDDEVGVILLAHPLFAAYIHACGNANNSSIAFSDRR